MAEDEVRPSFCDGAQLCGEGQDDDAIMKELECSEGKRLVVPGGVGNVRRAWYGDPKKRWREDEGGRDCTAAVVNRMEDQGEDRVVAANAWLGCDPAPGTPKVLLIELETPMQAPEAQATFPKKFAHAEDVPSAPQWVLFVRHAQAGHNVNQELVHNPDNALTTKGKRQALDAGEGHLGKALNEADLIITSPLTRAMETTALLLDGATTASGYTTPCEDEHSGSEDSEVSAHSQDLGAPPRVMVHAAATERWTARCDEGTSKTELLERLPKRMKCWEGWDDLPERWWADPSEDPWKRAEAFIELVRERPEKRIAIVGHGGFWDTLLGKYLDNCGHVFCDRQLS